MHEHVLPADLSCFRTNREQLGKDIPEYVFPVSPDKPVAIEDLAYLRHGYWFLSDKSGDLDEQLAVEELRDFKTVGGHTVLECSARAN